MSLYTTTFFWWTFMRHADSTIRHRIGALSLTQFPSGWNEVISGKDKNLRFKDKGKDPSFED